MEKVLFCLIKWYYHFQILSSILPPWAECLENIPVYSKIEIEQLNQNNYMLGDISSYSGIRLP